MTTRNYLAQPADSKDLERITKQIRDALQELREAIESIETVSLFTDTGEAI
jgi:signal transduction histidine kinase